MRAGNEDHARTDHDEVRRRGEAVGRRDRACQTGKQGRTKWLNQWIRGETRKYSADNGAGARTKGDQRQRYRIKGAEDNPERGGTDGRHDSETGCRDRSGAADGIKGRSSTIKA